MSQPSFYSGLSLVRSELNDGGLSLAATGSRPTILIVGPATEGPTNFPQLVVEDGDVRRLYGQDTEMQKKVAEIVAQAGTEAYFIYVMRIGGIAPKIEIESAAGGTITLTPLHYEDREAVERLKVLLLPHTVNGVEEQRVIIYDQVEEGYVWDSHSILQIVEKPFFVEQTGTFGDSLGAPISHGVSSTGVFTPGEIPPLLDFADQSQYTNPSITANYAVGDRAEHYIWLDSFSTDTFAVTIRRQGNDGQTVPLVQKYVFLDRALESLTFKEFDYILPCGGYHLDAPNIADSISGGLIVHHELQGAQAVHSSVDFSTLPTGTGPSKPSTDLSIDSNNVLGWLWQTEFEGKKYYYMSAKKGWDLFEPDSDEVVITVNDDVANLVLKDNSNNQHTYQITFGSGFAAAGATQLEFAFDASRDLVASAVTSGSSGNVVYTIGVQDTPSMNDIKTKLESDLDSQIATALSATGTLVSVSTTLSSGNEFLSVHGTPQHTSSDFHSGAFTPQVAGSLTIGFEFTLDAVSVTINKISGSTSTITETAGVLVIEIANGATLTALEAAIGLHTGTEITVTASNINNGSAVTENAETSISGGSTVTSFGVAHTTSFENNYLDHEELTGEAIPSEVEALFESALATEFRECSFAHLMGSWCHKSSSTWKTIMTCMTFEGPATANSPVTIGKIPTYTSIAGKLAIDTAAEGGKGILGYKFSAGAPAYRAQILGSIASSSDGYAYGGLILTKGSNLPSGIEPYGIDDADEAKDVKGFGVDIGKYIVPTAMWITHNNSFDQYYGDLTGIVTGMIGITPIGNEPIGPVNGSVSGVTSTFASRIQARSIGKLAQAGYTTVVYNPVRGVYLNNMRTLAHRYSDYRKVSTIRAVNRVVQGVRNLAQDYIGLAYNSANVASLRTAINGYLRSEQTAGVHNGAVAQIAFSREDRMLGNITIRLTMVPPYAIESINIVTSLIADESNLQ